MCRRDRYAPPRQRKRHAEDHIPIATSRHARRMTERHAHSRGPLDRAILSALSDLQAVSHAEPLNRRSSLARPDASPDLAGLPHGARRSTVSARSHARLGRRARSRTRASHRRCGSTAPAASTRETTPTSSSGPVGRSRNGQAELPCLHPSRHESSAEHAGPARAPKPAAGCGSRTSGSRPRRRRLRM